MTISPHPAFLLGGHSSLLGPLVSYEDCADTAISLCRKWQSVTTTLAYYAVDLGNKKFYSIGPTFHNLDDISSVFFQHLVPVL